METTQTQWRANQSLPEDNDLAQTWKQNHETTFAIFPNMVKEVESHINNYLITHSCVVHA